MSRARLGMLLYAGLLTGRPGAGQGTGPTRDFARSQAATVGGAVAPGWRGLGGFVAGDVRFGSMLGAFAPFVGAEAALLLGHRAADDHDAVFVFGPSATLDLAPVAAGRFGVGVTYRSVGGASRASVPDSDLRGFVGLARVRVGRF